MAFEKALDQAVGQKTDVKSLVSKRSLEARDLDETVTREEVFAALCIALGKPDLGDQCRLYKRFGGEQTAVVRLTEADARSLLGLGKLRVRWVNCRIKEHVEVFRCFRCQGLAVCRAAARFQAGKVPAGGVGVRLTWPRSARLHLGA